MSVANGVGSGRRRALSIPVRDMIKRSDSLRVLPRELHESHESHEINAWATERPKTRGDCRQDSGTENAQRPCPWASCKFNLYLDVNGENGTVKINFPDREPEDMPEDGSCALDIADRGGTTLDSVGELMNLTRERIRQLEVKTLRKLRRGNDEMLGRDDEDADGDDV